MDDFGPEKNCLRAAIGAPGEIPCHFSYGIYKGFAHFSKRRYREHFRQDFGEAEKHQKTTLSQNTKFATPPRRKPQFYKFELEILIDRNQENAKKRLWILSESTFFRFGCAFGHFFLRFLVPQGVFRESPNLLKV